MADSRIYPVAHQLLQDLPALRFEDVASCETCGALIVAEAERLSGLASLKRSATVGRLGGLTIDDVRWNQRPEDILKGFNLRLLRNHDRH